MKITITAIKADVGSIGGHTRPSSRMLQVVGTVIEERGISSGLLIDRYIGYTGDDIHILMTHTHGVGNEIIHKLAFDAFMQATETAKAEGMYGAGQDLLSTAFSGNVRGMGPGVAEMEIEERPAEAVALITADKTEPGAFNHPFYRLFCDPAANTGLLLNPTLTKGVEFRIMDVQTGKTASLHTPEEIFVIAAALMYPGRYVVESIRTRDGEPILTATTDRLNNIAGTYVGKDDPAALIRLQKNFPATEEACAMFKYCHFVAGNTRGSHHMPLMPVKRNTSSTANYCIPIVSVSLFSMTGGKLGQSVDAFETSDWDYFRRLAVEKSEMMRAQGFIHPATLIPHELEYNKGYKSVMAQLETKFKRE
ncbi:MAG: dihydroorotate dehydrogenase [Desulfobulbaceae bacterium BRH_c16a]|nr:MAG: dihydroorotate dehydrogenase [Desulfobulbaceae bacterium BRH_c16a]